MPGSPVLAVRGELDEVSAPVAGVALALDQAALLELVEQPDELAAVVAERVGDRALGRVRAFGQRDQDAEVVRVEARLLEGVHRLALGGEAEALEQEHRRLHELDWEPLRGMRCRYRVFSGYGHVNRVAQATVVVL